MLLMTAGRGTSFTRGGAWQSSEAESVMLGPLLHHLHFWWGFFTLLRALALMVWFGSPVHLHASDVWSIGMWFSPTKVGTGGGGGYSKPFSRTQSSLSLPGVLSETQR